MEPILVAVFLLIWLGYNALFFSRMTRVLQGWLLRFYVAVGVVLLSGLVMYGVSNLVAIALHWRRPIGNGYTFLVVYGTMWGAVVIAYVMVDWVLMRGVRRLGNYLRE